MQKFKVTTWPDTEQFTIEILYSNMSDMYQVQRDEASELLKCLKSVLAGEKCDHVLVHRLEEKSSLYVLMLSISERYVKTYTINKRQLVELKTELLGALNG